MSGMKRICICLGLVMSVASGPVSAREQDQSWRLGVYVLSNGGRGVKIQDVYDNSPAESLGLVPGQIIWSVNGQKCTNALQFRKLIFQSGDRVSLIILEGGFWYRITARLSGPGAAGAVAGAAAPAGEPKSSSPFQDVQKKRITSPEIRP